MVFAAAQAQFQGAHVGEFLPAVIACGTYLLLYERRVHTLAREGRPVPAWRTVSFATGAMLAAVVQLSPFDNIADEVLVAHVIQHIIIGDICTLLIVLGLTGPVLQPLLRIRVTRPLRTLANPLIALVLWAVDLYAWHLPVLYQLAIRVDLVHALEHACLLWFGMLLWMALIGPLPKPRWFTGWGHAGYVIAVRFLGAVLANIFLWAQTVFYPVYNTSDAAHGVNPLSDENLAGGVMMIEQIILTTLLLGWLLYRFINRDEARQELVDLAARHGVDLDDARAARAVHAGAEERLRQRILSGSLGPENEPPGADPSHASPHTPSPGEQPPT